MTEKIRKRIKRDSMLQAKLMLATGKSNSTIIKWANENDDRLQTIEVIRTIKEHVFIAEPLDDDNASEILAELNELVTF